MAVDLSKQTADFSNSMYDLLRALELESGGTITPDRFILIGLVKVKMDEMMPEGEGVEFEVQDLVNTTDNLDVVINAMIDECAKYLHQTAPLTVLEGKLASTAVPVNNGDGTGYVLVPDDYIRMQSFMMDGWKREVNDIITSQDPKYKLQSSKYTRGGLVKPVCVKTKKLVDAVMKDVIEYYSIPSGDHTLTHFSYIPEVVAENVQDNLVEALTWICAWQVMEIVGRHEQASKAFEQIKFSYNNLL